MLGTAKPAARIEPPEIFRALVFSCGIAATWFLFVQVGFSQSVGTATKANLDLPYDAAGEGDDEAALEDLILFYGGVYEANDVVFCLDYSESMRGGEIELQTREALRAIGELGSKTRFGIVFYGGRADVFRPQLVPANPANKSAAKRAVTGTQLSLGTCMGPALVKAIRLVEGEAHGTIILAGDGNPTDCAGGSHTGGGAGKHAVRKRILSRTAAANGGNKTKLYSIYVGDPSQTDPVQFMRLLSQANGGSFHVVATR